MIPKGYLKSFFFCIPLLFLFSCGGSLKGHAYLDENGNDQQDSGEPNLANLAFTVTLDDEEIATGQTSASGKYSIDMEGSGTYCVQIDSSSLSATNDDGTSPSIAALVRPHTSSRSALALTTSGGPSFLASTSESDCGNSTDDDSDGDTDCDDSDCFGDTTDCTEETNCTDEEDNDDDGDTDCDDSDCDSDSSCDSTTTDSTDSEAVVSSGSACDDSTGGSLDLDVPIAEDYTGVDNLEAPDDVTVSRGDTISIDIQYPESCDFDSYFLSTSLTPMNILASAYEESTGQINFNTIVADAADDIDVSDALSVADDAIATYSLDLCIGEVVDDVCESDGSLTSKDVTVTPTMTCPDDSAVTLATHTISIDSDNDFEVSQSVSGTQSYSETITVTTTIVNNSSVDYTSDEIELTLTTPDYTTSASYDSSCNNLGSSATCAFDIDGGDTVTLTTTFVLPATLSSNTTFEMTSSLDVTADGSTATFTGDAISFSLVCNSCI